MRRIDRRRLLQLSSAGAVAASAGSLATILAARRAPAYAQGSALHWLRWADFVPASDQLLRNQIAAECQKVLGIKLALEMINANDIQARVTSAVQSGSGPDIILVVNNWPQLYSESVAMSARWPRISARRRVVFTMSLGPSPVMARDGLPFHGQSAAGC